MLYQLSYEATHWEQAQLLTSLPMCGFIAQLVEYRTGIAEVVGSNPILTSLPMCGFIAQLVVSHWYRGGRGFESRIDLAPNVWLHSSVGRASHRYRGGHGFESRRSLNFFQASSFQLLTCKLENLLR